MKMEEKKPPLPADVGAPPEWLRAIPRPRCWYTPDYGERSACAAVDIPRLDRGREWIVLVQFDNGGAESVPVAALSPWPDAAGGLGLPLALLPLCDEADALASKATLGPWLVAAAGDLAAIVDSSENDVIPVEHKHAKRWPLRIEDAAFIARSRTLVPDLAAALRDAATQVRALTAALARIRSGIDSGAFDLADVTTIAMAALAGLPPPNLLAEDARRAALAPKGPRSDADD